MNNLNKILIYKINKNAKIPTISHKGEDMGYDIYSCDDVIVSPKKYAFVPTGIKISFPKGYGGIVSNRSSLGYKENLLVYPGIIDSGYTGELGIKIYNMGNKPYIIKKGQKFAQIIIKKVYTYFDIEEVDKDTFENTDIGQRKEKGFGSSGK